MSGPLWAAEEESFDPWRHAPAPHEALAICVVLPVRNEASGLRKCLAALARQMSPTGDMDPRHCEVLLLANNCDDGSADIARDFFYENGRLRLHIAEVTLPPALAHIGHVRRLLMNAAARRLRLTGTAGIIASTDGDTEVAPDWLMQIQHAMAQGVQAVGGRITIATRDDTDALLRRRRRCDDAYRLACERIASLLDPDTDDPWPRHYQHFCGSLALTRSAYLRVGGLPRVTHLEDEALISELRRQDMPVRHSPQVRVVTSGRRMGRAGVGLAWQLRQWADEAGEHSSMKVEAAAVLAGRFRARQQLRVLWQLSRSAAPSAIGGTVLQLATRWQLDADTLVEMVRGARHFGALWDALQLRVPEADVALQVPVREAIADLRRLARTLDPARNQWLA